MCVCVGYGCVCFLWVCGILDHNSYSSQVTAPFSRTFLAFLPRHDYHTPSTLGLAPRNISIAPEWNWNNVPEMNSSPLPPPYSVFFIPPPYSTPLSPPHTTHLQHRFLLSCRKNPPVRPFSPLSQLFVSAGMIGSFGSDISSLTSC